MRVVNTGIYRANLNYSVVHTTSAGEKLKKLQNLIQEIKGSGIIYTATVKAVEDLVPHYGPRMPRNALSWAPVKESTQRKPATLHGR